MNSASTLRHARRRAGLTQRQAASLAGLTQAAVARIESGRVVPRVDTLSRLLRACGTNLTVEPRRGEGVDVSLIRSMLRLSDAERARRARTEGQNLERILRGDA
jgi:transcriptional regulator with XRE-family HTH domain